MVINQEIKGQIAVIQIIELLTNALTNTLNKIDFKMGKNIILDIFFVLIFLCTYPFILLFVWIFTTKLKKLLIEALEIARATKIETEEDYKQSKRIYEALSRVEKIPPVNDAPFFMKWLINRVIPLAQIMLEFKKELGEQLYLRPKNVTDAQLEQISKELKNSGFYDRNALDDDDDDTYSKLLALGQIKFLER